MKVFYELNTVLDKSMNLPKNPIKNLTEKINSLKLICKKHYKDDNVLNCFLILIKKMFKILFILEQWNEISLQKELLENIRVYLSLSRNLLGYSLITKIKQRSN